MMAIPYLVTMTVSLAALAAPVLASPKVLSVRLGMRNNTVNGSKRDTFSTSLNNYLPGMQYFATVSIGTPAQNVQLIADTGSADTWVFAPGVCQPSELMPCLGGSFDPQRSSSYSELPDLGLFFSKYGDGSIIEGPYFADRFSLGGETIDGLTMGLGQHSQGIVHSGILGLSMSRNEARTGHHMMPYENFPDMLASQGLISSKAFSLYLDDINEATGSLLFGGYDTEKFSGDLVMVPIVKDLQAGTILSYTIALSGFGWSINGKTTLLDGGAGPYPVLLDSGTSISFIPPELFEPLAKQFGLIKGQRVHIVDCDIAARIPEGTTIDFLFGSKDGPKIAVPLQEMAVPVYDHVSGEQIHILGEPVCQFGVYPQENVYAPFVLGQTFLRSAYVLHDLENLAIGLAQAKYNASSSNIVEYPSSGGNPAVVIDAPEDSLVRMKMSPRPTRTITPIPFSSVSHPTDQLPKSFPSTNAAYVTPVTSLAIKTGGGVGSRGSSMASALKPGLLAGAGVILVLLGTVAVG